MPNKSIISILSLTLLTQAPISEANSDLSQKKSDSSFTSTLTSSNFKRNNGSLAIDQVVSNFTDIRTACLSGFTTSSGSSDYVSATKEIVAFKSEGSIVKSKIKSESQPTTQSCFKSETIQEACPSGYSGSVSKLKTYEAIGQGVSLISNTATSNSCLKTESQSFACGYGLSGSIYKQRTVSLSSSLTPIYGNWINKNVSCYGVETYQANCPTGMTGSITYQRSKWLDANLSLNYGTSAEVGRSCVPAESNKLASTTPISVIKNINLVQIACSSTNPDWTEECLGYAYSAFRSGMYFVRVHSDFEPELCQTGEALDMCGYYTYGPLYETRYYTSDDRNLCLIWSNAMNTAIRC